MLSNFCILLFVLAKTPSLLWSKFVLGKRLPTFKERLGLSCVRGNNELRVWIHAVSLGEVKAATPFVKLWVERESQVLFTTSTIAGLEEIKGLSLRNVEPRILPLDFSWVIRRWMQKFAPAWLIFVEGDLWPHLIAEAKRANSKVALVSGKISERSVKRWQSFPWVTKRLFGELDFIGVQNDEQKIRFQKLTASEIVVTGNFKCDLLPVKVDLAWMRQKYDLDNQLIFTLACTHDPEEEEILSLLKPLWQEWPHLVCFLAPRHIERSEKIEALLAKMKLPVSRWGNSRKGCSIVLVDQMGQLPHCYALSRCAILGGSFSSQKGGHNLLEPGLYGCPVLFGPHIHAQTELADLVKKRHLGEQVKGEELLAKVKSKILVYKRIEHNHLQNMSAQASFQKIFTHK